MAAFLVGGLAIMGGAAALSFSVISSPSAQAVRSSAVPAAHTDQSLGATHDLSALGSVPSVPTTPATVPITVPVVVVVPAAKKAAPKAAGAKAAAATATIPKTVVAKAKAPGVLPPITYTVKPGDNLFVIAQWFKAHGYGAIYEANKAVIGDNPDLIFPGEQITISGGSLSMGA